MDNRQISEDFLGQPGINLCWGDTLHSPAVKNTLENITNKGYKFVRIWLCRWGIKGLWHEKYIPEIPESASDLSSLNQILTLSKKLNIKVILVIIPHAHFLVISQYEIENPVDGWLGNPFRYVSQTPYHFFRSQETRSYFENFLVHLYKTFPSGAEPIAVELCNEVDMINGLKNGLIIDWHRQMLAFCKNLNPGILLTTSTAVPDSIPGLLKLRDLDMISLHNYRFPYSSAIANLCYWKNRLSKFEKPIWLTEFDFSSQQAKRDISSLAYLQSAALAAPCLKYATGVGYWWWENTLHQQIIPEQVLDIVYEWLSQNKNYQYIDDLINTFSLGVVKEKKEIKMTRLGGKNLRFIGCKIFHKIISKFSIDFNDKLTLQCSGKFLVLIEASSDNPLQVEICHNYRLQGICYNVDPLGESHASVYFDTTQTKSWITRCVQILILQEI
jgi:Cellulase (glycosyl hydrolase family 5)